MSQGVNASTLPLWQQVTARTAEILPALAASVFVLVVGVALGWLAGRVALRLLRRRSEAWSPDHLGLAGSLGPWNQALVAARSIQWFVIFCSTIVALYALDPRLASALAERVLLYVPHLAGAVVIMVAGVLLSRFVARSVLIASVNHDIRPARLLAGISRTAIVILSAAIALEQTGIGQRTVLVAFGILFGGLTMAASIALGLAMQDPLRRWLAGQERTRSQQEDETADTMHHV